ncbi:MAG TPA: transglutaminase domain-containing protein [Candidatus Dormibacteraeota bacterium]|nr:transglutaminase domain-containing protein [Candidatus Dormibacteraeota bacterium]
MRSAWSSEAALEVTAASTSARALRALRAWLATAELPSVALVLLLTLVVAAATVTMQWVKGSEILPGVAALGVVVMTVLALLRFIPSWVALPLGGVGAAVLPWYLNAAALRAAHPGLPYGLPNPATWVNAIAGTDSDVDTTLLLFLGCVAFWVVGGWLAWCTIRWRRPLLGLFPGAAVFATNVLNSSDEQNANTIYFLVLTIALLLWNGYRSSLLAALKSGLRLSSDSRWDFWETGVAATAGVMLLAIFVPPLTYEDQTVNLENGVFQSWAQFQQNLNHPVDVGRGGAASFSTGFSLDAGLNGALKKSTAVVFEYTYSGQYSGPRYFRGVNLQNGVRSNQWAFLNNPFGFQFFVARNSTLPYRDTGLQDQLTSTLTVSMLRPPAVAPDLLFYPGQLEKTDRDTVAVESYKATADPVFGSVDRVVSSHPASSAGQYKVTVDYPNPTEDQLRSAGVGYPTWIQPYLSYPGLTSTPAFTSSGTARPGRTTNTITVIPASGASSPTALLIKGLADQVTAGIPDNYDKAAAIETYLRTNYHYTLTPPPPKDASTDPLQSFLFDSKQGYCEYFATAMGDMLRAEGIPSRLVNGFGPGTYDAKLKEYVVRESDAHTWVEAYFPNFGWITFEPTPDGTYFPIARAQAPVNCNRDNCASGEDTGGLVPATGVSKTGIKDLAGSAVPNLAGPLGSRGGFPYWALVPLALLALGALLLFAGSRFLRPRTATLVWKRLLLLSRLAGVEGPPGETPNEFGRRLGAAYPEAAKPLRDLAESFTVAAYAPASAVRPAAALVVARWEQVRPALLRKLVDRLRPAF